MSRKILCTGLIPALIFACGGCSSNNEKSKSTDNKPTVTTKDGLPVWETKQDQVRYLTVKDKIGDYNISFYEDFELVNTPKAKVEVKTWKTKIPNAGPLVGPLVFSVAVITDAKMAGETIQNPRQSLVDYTGGMANSAKLNGVQRGDLEQGHIHGLTFSRIEWSALDLGGKKFKGLCYVAVDNDKVIFCKATKTGENVTVDMKKAEAVIGSIKK